MIEKGGIPTYPALRNNAPRGNLERRNGAKTMQSNQNDEMLSHLANQTFNSCVLSLSLLIEAIRRAPEHPARTAAYASGIGSRLTAALPMLANIAQKL